MRRIDSANARANVNGAGKVGFHDNADLSGQDATYLTPNWLNILQEEMCNILEKNNIALNPNSKQQLFDLLATSADISALAVATQNLLDNKADKSVSMLAGTGMLGGGNLSANRSFSVAYGTTAGTATQGDDSRVNNGQTAYGWGNHAAVGYALASSVTASVMALNAALDTKYDKTGGLISGDVQIGSSTNAATRKNLYVSKGGRFDAGVSSGGALIIDDASWVKLRTVEEFLGISRYVEFTTGTNEYRFDKPIVAPNLNTGGIGVGQTWQVFTAQRALNTTYTNTAGRSIMVIVSVAQGSVHSVVFIDGIKISGQMSTYNSGEPIVATTFIVPDGSTYRVSTSALEGTLSHWAELR